MSKYNNYAGIGTGDGVNKVAILDPNATEPDPVFPATMVMNKVLTIKRLTPDPRFPNFPGAVREWCINTAAIDRPGKSVEQPDGRSIYPHGNRLGWNRIRHQRRRAIRIGR